MLRIIQSSSASGAKAYYSSADYYSEGQELTGIWRGKGATLLGLHGEVQPAQWDALCDNLDPRTGELLTVRRNEHRRVGYDFNFHVPKSVSLLYGLTEDPRLLEAFEEAVEQTMEQMEAEMQTRVRTGNRDEDRLTGNMAWGQFVHTTARPVDGIPDPHLHAHCFVFNTTWDEHERRWKAGQFAQLKRDAPYFEALFHSRLAERMESLGLPTRRTNQGWELRGISDETIAAFSRRTAQIEEEAARRGIADAARKDALGARTRSSKQKELSMTQLQTLWRERLGDEASDALNGKVAAMRPQAATERGDDAARAVSSAIAHVFERDSVVPERTLLAQALRNGYGTTSAQAIHTEMASRPLIRAFRHQRACVTTPEILAEEQRMVAFARDGRGTQPALADDERAWSRDWLGDDQKAAIRHLLHSPDRVILLRGGAGTGKTALMQEAVEAIAAGAPCVRVVAA